MQGFGTAGVARTACAGRACVSIYSVFITTWRLRLMHLRILLSKREQTDENLPWIPPPGHRWRLCADHRQLRWRAPGPPGHAGPAEQRGCAPGGGSCVLTFEPHPRDYFAGVRHKPEL